MAVERVQVINSIQTRVWFHENVRDQFTGQPSSENITDYYFELKYFCFKIQYFMCVCCIETIEIENTSSLSVIVWAWPHRCFSLIRGLASANRQCWTGCQNDCWLSLISQFIGCVWDTLLWVLWVSLYLNSNFLSVFVLTRLRAHSKRLNAGTHTGTLIFTHILSYSLSAICLYLCESEIAKEEYS